MTERLVPLFSTLAWSSAEKDGWNVACVLVVGRKESKLELIENNRSGTRVSTFNLLVPGGEWTQHGRGRPVAALVSRRRIISSGHQGKVTCNTSSKMNSSHRPSRVGRRAWPGAITIGEPHRRRRPTRLFTDSATPVFLSSAPRLVSLLWRWELNSTSILASCVPSFLS